MGFNKAILWLIIVNCVSSCLGWTFGGPRKQNKFPSGYTVLKMLTNPSWLYHSSFLSCHKCRRVERRAVYICSNKTLPLNSFFSGIKSTDCQHGNIDKFWFSNDFVIMTNMMCLVLQGKENAKPRLSPVAWVMFASLVIDLMGFTIILPLMPKLLDHYSLKGSTSMGVLETTVRSLQQTFNIPERFNSVLTGGNLNALFLINYVNIYYSSICLTHQ